MSKWSRIKNNIYNERLYKVDTLFTEVSKNINNLKVPRVRWTAPLENWTIDQIQEDNVFRLSLQEYAYFKNIVEDLDQNLVWRKGNEKVVIDEFKKLFSQHYIDLLDQRETDIKLEITAELIDEKQFPLHLFYEWYLDNWHLPPEQFNEAIGDFWGNVWKNTMGGAGLGALAGGVAGGVPTGGAGTFAGAGLGALAGGAAGGLYGAGKGLLKKVWNWHNKKHDFEQTKEKALEVLKKLKEISKGFDLNPNFLTALNKIIEELGTTKAYKKTTSGPTDQNAAPNNPFSPFSKPPTSSTSPTTSSTSPTTSSTSPTTSSTPPTTSSTTPMSKDEMEAEQQRVAARIAARHAHYKDLQNQKAAKALQDTERKKAERDAEDAKKKLAREVNSKEDILRIYKKAESEGDLQTLFDIGLAAECNTKGDVCEIDLDKFKKQFASIENSLPYDPDDPDYKTQIEYAKKVAEAIEKEIEEKKLAGKGTPKEEPESSAKSGEVDGDKLVSLVAAQGKKKNLSETERKTFFDAVLKVNSSRLINFSTTEKKNIAAVLGIVELLGKGKGKVRIGKNADRLHRAIKTAVEHPEIVALPKLFKYYVENPDHFNNPYTLKALLDNPELIPDDMDENYTVEDYKIMLIEGKKIFPKHNIQSLSIQDKIEYAKNLLRC